MEEHAPRTRGNTWKDMIGTAFRSSIDGVACTEWRDSGAHLISEIPLEALRMLSARLKATYEVVSTKALMKALKLAVYTSSCCALFQFSLLRGSVCAWPMRDLAKQAKEIVRYKFYVYCLANIGFQFHIEADRRSFRLVPTKTYCSIPFIATSEKTNNLHNRRFRPHLTTTRSTHHDPLHSLRHRLQSLDPFHLAFSCLYRLSKSLYYILRLRAGQLPLQHLFRGRSSGSHYCLRCSPCTLPPLPVMRISGDERIGMRSRAGRGKLGSKQGTCRVFHEDW